MTYPRNVRIIESNNEFNHFYPVGRIVTLSYDDGKDDKYRAYHAFGNDPDGHPIHQSIMDVDFEELEDALSGVKTETKTEKKEEELAPRVKYLYSVQDADGYTLASTRDRDYARELKASCGGKKEGIIIMAYAPVKEIR